MEVCKHNGKRFERLIVLGKVGNRKNGGMILRCQCDCGIVKDIGYSNLISGNTTSCGCYHKEVIASKHPWTTELNRYMHTTVNRRSLEFTLTEKQFAELCQQPCYYCHTPPATKMYVGHGLKNGLDRISSNRGYHIDNVVTCCPTCNDMKGTMFQEHFLEQIRKISINLFSK